MGHSIVYSILKNYDTKNQQLFAMFLLGSDDEKSEFSGKRTRRWQSLLSAPNEAELITVIERYKNWGDTVFQNKRAVTSDSILEIFPGSNTVENAFYSNFYVLQGFSEVHPNETEIINVILMQYNAAKFLYTRSQATEVALAIQPELIAHFGPEKAKIIARYIWHAPKTDKNEYKRLEVI